MDVDASIKCIGVMPRLIASPQDAAADYVLYGADTPNTWKVATLLEELKLPYDVVCVDIMKDEQKAPDYVKNNPNGRTPTLVDRTKPSDPVAVFESGAIMLYLCEKHPSALLPARDAALKSEVIQWLFWQVSALGPMMGQLMYMKRIAHGGAGVPIDQLAFSIERFQKEVERLYAILEARLAGRDYLCGEGQRGTYTIADIACWGYAAQHWWAGVDVAPYPNVRAWIACVGGHPCVQTGLYVPGRSLLGEGGALFAEFLSDEALRARLVASANARGAAHFGWKDLTALKNGSDGGQVAFASHVPGAEAAGAKAHEARSNHSQPEGLALKLVLAAAGGAVVATLARRLARG